MAGYGRVVGGGPIAIGPFTFQDTLLAITRVQVTFQGTVTANWTLSENHNNSIIYSVPGATAWVTYSSNPMQFLLDFNPVSLTIQAPATTYSYVIEGQLQSR